MLDQIITSKTRIKLLKLFLINIDERYYLRELERKLDESLSPLRRQLIKLEQMGILITEYEGNLKYYWLNKNFVGIEELRRLVGAVKEEPQGRETPALTPAPTPGVYTPGVYTPGVEKVEKVRKVRSEVVAILVISFFVLATATFVVYTNMRNVREVATLVLGASSKPGLEINSKPGLKDATALSRKNPDEMASKRWKILTGTIPVLSGGSTEGEKRVEEL